MQRLKTYAPLILWTLLILLLPPLAAWLGGHPLDEYLRFPLTERAWDPLPYSPRVYWTATLMVLLAVLIALRLGAGRSAPVARAAATRTGMRPPRWAQFGVICLVGGLLLASSDSTGLGGLLAGFGLLLLINADLLRRTGHALMTERPGYFRALLLGGLLLGWLMHYLNLFLQSWTYPGLAGLGTPRIVALHSLEYALLLPLLLSLRQWLAGHDGLLRRLTHGRPIPASAAADQGWILLGIGALGMTGAGIWPDRIYPLAWVAPLPLALGLSLLAGRSTPLAGIRHGDWSRVLLTVLAALLLGAWDQAWNVLFGPTRAYAISLLQGPGAVGLPLPAFFQLAVFGLLGLWVGDQLSPPWQHRPKRRFVEFPVNIRID